MQISETFPKPARFVSHVQQICPSQGRIPESEKNNSNEMRQAFSRVQTALINGSPEHKFWLKGCLKRFQGTENHEAGAELSKNEQSQ